MLLAAEEARMDREREEEEVQQQLLRQRLLVSRGAWIILLVQEFDRHAGTSRFVASNVCHS